ncbi:MAG: sugar phosphate isomerase/epimerase [Emcibacteraceae bacterium]|nr:sugar phosphate isomerase/epimerase [Emcibacteraceae bacterium]
MDYLNRRTFVKSIAAAGLAGMSGSFNALAAASNINVMGKLNNISLQLYTVRSLMRENVELTVADVAKIGYSQVEFAGYYDRSASEIKNMLDENGLTSPSTHVDLNMVQGDNLKALIEFSHTVGHKYLIVPFLQPEERETIDQYKKLTESFNRIGEECKKAGLKLAYHNHEFEFKATDGVVPMDIMLNESDADLFNIQMDLYWAIDAGINPVGYFKRYPGRFPLCHVKDMTGDGRMVDVGSGAVDFAKIFAHSELAGLEHYVVEHDQPENPLESVTNSFKALRDMTVG